MRRDSLTPAPYKPLRVPPADEPTDDAVEAIS
jgi:hypothetical protein